MKTKIVTDSASDIAPELAQSLGIEIMPVYINFGDEVYRDGVDMGGDGFYKKLSNSFIYPMTSPPTPEDFAKVYSDCLEDAESIISIHISATVSDICASAKKATKLIKGEDRVKVIDSRFISVGQALIVIAAAKLAGEGESDSSIIEETQENIRRVHLLMLADTMKYLAAGGRVNKAIGAVANMFRIKPLLTFKDGEVVRSGLVRTYSGGINALCEFVETSSNIRDLAIAYSGARTEADGLIKRLGSVFPEEKVYLTQMGAGLGTHFGPGTLVVAFRSG